MASEPRATRGSWFRAEGDKGFASRADLDKLLLPHERKALASWHWEVWGRDEQLPPPGDWRVWLICAGRGFGKTRAGAEWVRDVARHEPDARIALVGASLGEVRSVMVEGESGILAAAPGALAPDYEPSLKRLSWPNGAQAFLYSAGEPESLRGPQHSHAWCDEVAKWDNAGGRALSAWDNLQMGMRLGDHPRLLATSTPRRVALMMRLLEEARDGAVAVAKGRTADNAGALPVAYYKGMLAQYEGSTLGRQELEGEMLAEADGALWTRALLEECRTDGKSEKLSRVVIGVDPPASERGDACGIVVCGLGTSGVAQVLADCSVEKATPERWARAVANAAEAWCADRVVAEANQGGQMVASVLRAAMRVANGCGPTGWTHRWSKRSRPMKSASDRSIFPTRHGRRDSRHTSCPPYSSLRWSGPTAWAPCGSVKSAAWPNRKRA
ncbi:terminase large subunit domain-containing protein [Qipengyuania sphaerica]|uniref:terminase large subunit domain-containing protein n=1 Tax=Qipengyuania sphaerica TaxID=2867243 RepID=UPI001C868A69|nr:terminase family protein [Qipengyuania sphaerica]MBX7541371.1 terminase family protein [Qipengyuania sphaerica]